MRHQRSRRALIGGAGLAAVVAVAPAISAALPASAPDRAAWDEAHRNVAGLLTKDAEVCGRFNAAEAAGTLTDELEADWDASASHIADAEWALFETPAPDADALEWKLGMLRSRNLAFDNDIAAQIIADLRRINGKG